MDCQEYVQKMTKIQKSLILYLDREDNIEENYENLFILIKDQNIKNNKNEFKIFLHLVDCLSKYHFRTKGFFEKIYQILMEFKEEFGKFLTNTEIFNIFKENKLVLYFLIQKKIIYVDSYIVNCMLKSKMKKYPNYFINEIKPFISEKLASDIEEENRNLEIDMEPEIFEKNRQRGENESELCRLIQDDNISEFISYISKNDILLEKQIQPSIFETNNLLLTTKIPNLIEYAAFHGSIQIFKYLLINGKTPRPYLWIYAIHGDNPEMIHFIEENNVEIEDKTYDLYLLEALKSHHNGIANYFRENYMKDKDDFITVSKSVCFYNFDFFPSNLFNRNVFVFLCQYDYFYIVSEILKNKSFDINFVIKENNLRADEIVTPFVAAVSNGNFEIVELLMNHSKVDLNSKAIILKWGKSEESQNALYLATSNNSEKIVELLLKNNFDVNMESIIKNYGPNDMLHVCSYVPIFEAILNRNLKIINLLLSSPNIDLNIQKNVYNYYSIIPLNITNNNHDPKAVKRTSCIYFAISNNSIDAVKLLLSNPNIDLNMRSITRTSHIEYKETPLFLAIKIKNIDIIKLLVSDPRVDINLESSGQLKDKKKKESPLCTAIRNKNIEITKILLSCDKINVNAISYIIDKKVNDELFNYSKSNALSVAILKKQEEIIKLLLSHPNIDVNQQNYICLQNDNQYKSPLYLAVEKEDENIVKLLLTHPDINVNYISVHEDPKLTIIENKTILYLAISKQNLAIVKLLLESPNIDVNLKSYTKKNKPDSVEEQEESPLSLAFSLGNLDIIQLLMKNPNINLLLKHKRSILSPQNFFVEEKTTIQIAILSSNIDIIKCLFDNLSVANCQINFNELINMTDDDQVKAMIYDEINKLKLIN